MAGKTAITEGDTGCVAGVAVEKGRGKGKPEAKVVKKIYDFFLFHEENGRKE